MRYIAYICNTVKTYRDMAENNTTSIFAKTDAKSADRIKRVLEVSGKVEVVNGGQNGRQFDSWFGNLLRGIDCTVEVSAFDDRGIYPEAYMVTMNN